MPQGLHIFYIRSGINARGTINAGFPAELEDNFVATFTWVVRKDLAGDAIHFSPDLPTCDDWECFGRVARCGPAAYLDTETAWQHGHSGPRITRLSFTGG